MNALLKETDQFFSSVMAPMTKRLFYINALFFILINILILISQGLTQRIFFLTPYQAMLQGHIWQFVTYMFSHIGFFHFFFNMLTLYFFGSLIENRMTGRRYFRFLLTAGIMAGLAHTFLTLVTGHGDIPIIGFSGAVYALLTATVMYFPNLKVNLYFILPIPIRVLALIFGVLMFLQVIQDLTTVGLFGGSVSHLAHLVGIFTGIALIKAPFIMDWVEDLHIPFLQRRPKMVRGKKRMNMGHPGRHTDPDDRYNDPHWYLDQ